MHRLPDARAWMNKNTELQEKLNNGTLFEENRKIAEEKEKAQREQDERTEKLSTSKQAEAIQTQSGTEQTDTALLNELREWQDGLKAIRANSTSEDLTKLSQEELIRKIDTLSEANDLLIKAVEVTRSRHEESHELLKDTFRQIVSEKDNLLDSKSHELEQKNSELQNLRERIKDAELDFSDLVNESKCTFEAKNKEIANLKAELKSKSDELGELQDEHKTLSLSRTRENTTNRAKIDTLEKTILEYKSTIKEQDSKLQKIHEYVSRDVYDAVVVNEINVILDSSHNINSKLHQTNHSLFEEKASLDIEEKTTPKIPVKEITITRLEGPSLECDIEHKVYSFEEANYKIKEMSKNAPRHGGYDKVRFSVVFEDNPNYEQEKIYTGRIDMMHYTVEKNSREQNIEQHIHDHLSFHTGTLKPDYMSQKSYDDFLSKNTTAESRRDINEFLDKYIPDSARHPSIILHGNELSNQQSEVKSKEVDKHQTQETKSTSNELSHTNQSSSSKTNQHSKDKSKSRGDDGGLGY